MRCLDLSRARVVGALLTILLLATLTSAASAPKPFSGRFFTGYYDFYGVQAQGDVVQVTLHLRIFNHSSEDMKSVIVTLTDSSPTGVLRGNFQPVKVWKSQHFIEMSQQFSISRRELAEWRNAPAQPNLMVLYQDSKGMSWQKPVQVSRRQGAR